MHCTKFFTAALLICTVSSLSAKPKIEFDTKEFDCGTFVEGNKDKLEAVFIVKNTGDENLKLTAVKPSCGCTVVKFDSLVLPGQTTKINSTVNIKGKKGSLSKMITVLSNAENDSSARLIIKANILEVLSISLSFIDMAGQTAKTAMQITSQKNNLKIADISFIPDQTAPVADTTKTAAKVTPLKIVYTLVPADTTRTDGMTGYRLELDPVTTTPALNGEFVISTNNPDKKELRIRGKVGK